MIFRCLMHARGIIMVESSPCPVPQVRTVRIGHGRPQREVIIAATLASTIYQIPYLKTYGCAARRHSADRRDGLRQGWGVVVQQRM